MNINKQLIDYSNAQSIPEIWAKTAEAFGDVIALNEPHSKTKEKIAYGELAEKIKDFAAGLQSLGVQPKSKIALISDNSARWFIADQGIMTAGAINVVRSSQAEKQELLYILENSESTGLVVDNIKTWNKLLPELENLPINQVILLSDEETPTSESFTLRNFSQLLEQGRKNTLNPLEQKPEDLATLIYTSGTTGRPKGVMLSHGNLLHQVNTLETIIQPEAGDRVLSILPSWHSYERAAEYFILSQGCSMIYTNIRHFKADLAEYKPHFMVGVPRVWESIYEGIQKQFRDQSSGKQKLVQTCLSISENYILARRIATGLSLNHLEASLGDRIAARLKAALLEPWHRLADILVYKKIRAAVGGNLRLLISGGGSLAMHLENFYEIVSIPILVGYGLTETSPVTNARQLEHNLRGSSGKPLPHTENRIVDLETGQELPSGEIGLVLLRGPQIMQGYYRQPEATAKVIDQDGWFNSGDLGWITPDGNLVLTGRAKDTIVLSNGENIEPQGIEDACIRSAYIDQIMLVGQDQKALGALIVPNLETVEKWSKAADLELDWQSSPLKILNSQPVKDLFRQELNREVKNRPGYRADDRISTFAFILEPFSQENGTMTQTLKIKRPVVTQRYQELIAEMFQ